MADPDTIKKWIALLEARQFSQVVAEIRASPEVLAISSTANLILATALEALGEISSAGNAFDRAVTLEPGNVIAQNNRADFLERRGQFTDALAGYEAALAIDPTIAALHFNLGRMLRVMNRCGEALVALDHAVALQPAMPEAQFERGFTLERLGREAEAERAYHQVLSLSPRHEGAWLNLVKLHYRNKRGGEAILQAEMGLSHLPTSKALHYWQGAALNATGRKAEALAALDRCLELGPEDFYALCDKGRILENLGGRDMEALAAFEAAHALEPRNVAALNGMAAASSRLGREQAAMDLVETALAIAPNSVSALLIRSSILQKTGRSGEAIDDLEKVIDLAPANPRGWIQLGDIRAARADHAEALRCYSRAGELAPNEPTIESSILWCLLHLPSVSRDEVVGQHREWAKRFGRPTKEPAGPFSNLRDAERQLKVGFVSKDFEEHPVGRLFASVLPAFDRRRLSITCYSNNPESDHVTDDIRSRSDRWQEIWMLDDPALAALVRADEIDILIDLSGHTNGNRLRCFALRPAPVQATLWGYPFTTGLPAMDYAIMDEAAVPQGADEMFVERVIRLPGGRFRFRPPAVDVPVAMPPWTRRGYVTFGSFNNVAKLNERVYEVWASLLREVPTSRLLLKWSNLGDPAVDTRIRDAFADRGITADRLALRGISPYDEMLAEYADVDIGLDPFPFSGGATSFEALWMGVPIVTLPGWQPVSRQTLAYLRAIGRESLAAKNEADYVAIAGRLAAEPRRLTEWRKNQRLLVERSSICDFAGAAQELEESFRIMWKRYLGDTSERLLAPCQNSVINSTELSEHIRPGSKVVDGADEAAAPWLLHRLKSTDAIVPGSRSQF